MGDIFVGDIDTRIILECGVDVSAGTTLEIHYVKPSGETGIWEADPVDGEETQIYYDTLEDDLDEAGDWQLQAYAELTSGWEGHGEIAILTVARPLDS
jgi:hypothetical protein